MTVIQELLPRGFPARFPQLTRMGAPQRFGGGLTQKPSEDSNLPSILWVGVGNEEWRWRVEYKSFEAYLKEKFPDSRGKAYYLMSIHDHLAQIPAPEIEAPGWSKAMELAKVARSEGRQFDCATWLHKAQESTKQELKDAVHKYLTGEDYEPYEMVYFKLFESQLPAVERALYVAARMVGWGQSARGGIGWNWCARIFWLGGGRSHPPRRSGS